MATATASVSDLSNDELSAMIGQAGSGKSTPIGFSDLWAEQQKRQEAALSAARQTGGQSFSLKASGDKGCVTMRGVPGAHSRFGLSLYPVGFLFLLDNAVTILKWIRDKRSDLSFGKDQPIGKGYDSVSARVEDWIRKLS